MNSNCIRKKQAKDEQADKRTASPRKASAFSSRCLITATHCTEGGYMRATVWLAELSKTLLVNFNDT